MGAGVTQEEIIKLAREAGFNTEREMIWVDGLEISPYMQRFAALVAAAEREACAQTARTAMLGAEWVLTKRVMKSIRARGQA